ncbi:MAG TPA: hypothetical protein VLX92_04900 [Kofleriaceae bacterium]|nr:hypothetical protein [Kofleriaceae bacterium]
MRNLPTFATALPLLAFAACTGGPGELQDPPALTITAPARSLIQDHAGQVQVTGTVTPNAEGTAIRSVMVNDVAATLNVDGTFTANVQVEAGASLIHTVATDAKGDTASDTRSVEAGQLVGPGTMIDNAITAAISPQAFGKIGDAAGTLIAQANLTQMISGMQPMVNKGGSCLGAKLYVDSLTITNAKIGLVPTNSGLMFSAELDGVDTKGHVTYDVACIGGSDTYEMTADAVLISATLDVTPNGMNGFTSTLLSPNVSLQNLNVSASGLPGDILDLIDMNSAIASIVSSTAETFMGPMVNQAFGALAGPQQLSLLGQTIDVQVAPSDVEFSDAGGTIVLDTSFLIQAAKNSKGFVSTQDGTPNMNPGMGMQLGIADNLANDMLAQVTSLGLLDISMPTNGGTFDSAAMSATSPPMISAAAADGKMQLVLPDMKVTFTQQGVPVASAALNATVDLQIASVNNGYGVAIQLGTPTIDIDTTNDIPNDTKFTNDDLSKAVTLALSGQIASISALLGSIPLPSVEGLQLTNVSVGADSGYVMLSGTLK